MDKVRFFGLFLTLMIGFWASVSFAQYDPGYIIDKGDDVLDPNSDRYITESGSSLLADGYDPDEFEIKMFGLPIFGDGEVLRDIQAGEPCGVTDLTLDSAGYAIYA